MSLLSPCVKQLSKYSFLVWDTTTQETYDNAGVDLTTVTSAKIIFKNLYDNSTYEIDITSNWQYLLGDGTTIHILDFPGGKMGEYEFFPDYMYEIKVSYVYGGTTYTATKTTGFRKIISFRVYQQIQQSNWVDELKCGCGCEKYSTGFRKFDYLHNLEVASNNCMIVEYNKILLALYRITGTKHEYDN